MAKRCDRSFDEAYLSGYLDLALTQAEEQRVRLHLEDCAHCRAIVEEMNVLRETTMKTSFRTPSDDSWNEAPKGGLSKASFGLGWMLVVLWTLGIGGFALWGLLTGPEDFWTKLLVLGGVGGFCLLAVSVLIDRLKTYRADPYRRVEK